MHVFQVGFYASGVFYALFLNRQLLFPFLSVIVLYFIASVLLPGAKDLSIRKKIMNATWNPPSEGNIIVRVPVRVQKVHKIIQSMPKETRPTLTHFAIKALGEVLVNQPSLNGTYSLGKFISFSEVNVSCAVNIGQGKDLAILLIKDVDKLSIQEIACYIKQKAATMKRSNGGQQHKEQMKTFIHIPVFLVSFLMEIVNFIANKLRIDFPSCKLQSQAFGAACITSLGSLGFQDAIAPFTDFANCTILLSANAVSRQPVVESDELVIGQVMNNNFMVDHRYVDGGNCTKLVEIYRKVFENPELYLKKTNQ